MHKLLVVLFLFLTIQGFAQNSPDAIVGEWYTDGKESVIKIEKSGSGYTGKIAWLKEPLNEQGKPKVDQNNPDESKRNAPILGTTILQGLQHKGKNEWGDGEIYDPKSGKTYSSNATLADPNTLKLRGYIGISLIGRTTTWTRKQN